MVYLLETTDADRRRRWQHIFNADQLPVLSNRARFRVNDHGRTEYVYDLALQKLTPAQVNSFAGYIARRTGANYLAIRAHMIGGVSWPLKARDTQVLTIEPEDPPATRPADRFIYTALPYVV